MTNPTPHGQVPEALPAIQRFEVVDCIDSKHVPAVIPNASGPWVRYEDHVAALRAQQPAPADRIDLHQALTDPENQPNQYGVEFGMSGTHMHFKIGNQLFKLAYEPDEQEEFDFMKRMLVNAFTTFTHDVKIALHAQQPCPTCAALARTVMLDQVSFDRKPDCYGIRQITDDEGVEEWEDIRTSPDVAREEANDMMATGRGEIYEVVPLWTTPKPSPAAQGDALSDDAVRVPLDNLHADAAYLIGRLREGSMPYARVIEIIRERIDAAKAAIRARAPADSVTAAAVGVVAGMSETVPFSDKSKAPPLEKALRYLKAMGDQRTNSAYFFDDGYPRRESAQDALATLAVLEQLAPTPPAQTADSVLEDAARLDWLALAGPTSICVVIDRPHDGEVEVATDDVTGYGKTLREAIDAARKQGANHD